MSTGSSTQVTRRGFLPRLRDARIRAKLALILLVPLAAVIALAGVRLFDIGQRAADAGQVEKLTRLGSDISALTQWLHIERMAAASYLSDPKAPEDAYDTVVRATDGRIATYRTHRRELSDVPDAVQGSLALIDDHLQTIDGMRTQIEKRDGIAVAEAVSRYGVVIEDTIGFGVAVAQFAGDGEVGGSLRATGAFAAAKAGAAELEAISYAARVTDDLSAEQRTAFIAAQTRQQEALLAFSGGANPDQRRLVNSVVTGDAVNLVDQVSNSLARGVAVSANDIIESFGAVVDLMRFAEQQLEAANLKLAAADRDAVVRQAAIESALVLLVLILAVSLAVILARSLNLSLRRLREGALAVANRDLPEAVARLRDARNLGEGGAEDIVRQVRDPIRLNTRDEIGQVAQAFNVVHREAVRIAAEQAALRTSVSTMFLNLARRSQSLVDRMIGELDMIERTEEDPKRLAQLFDLDHLATRMRRNDENLLVLAGADSSPPRREDALLVDALRAAQSEVELYNRVEFGTVDTDISVAAQAVNDVVRLIAELLDNATRFSPPNTIVVADARRVRDYLVIQVEDRGLGMSEEQMDQLNRRLAEPPGVDVAAFRLMGLAVVGLLAARYGIRVELRANLEGGTIAQVTLPGSIVVLPSRRNEGRSRNPAPEWGSQPVGSWDAMTSLATTATLPALAPEPWRQHEPETVTQLAHPQLPMFPSQRPPVMPGPSVRPTPDRPPLPTRVSRTIEAGGSPEPAPIPAAPIPAAQVPAAQFPAAQFPAAPIPMASTSMASAPVMPVPVLPPVVPAQRESNGWGAALAAMPPVPASAPPAPPAEERSESPIFVQMQQSWFRNHDGASPEEWGMPTAGYAPPPKAAAKQAAVEPVTAPPAAPPVSAPPVPAPRVSAPPAAAPAPAAASAPAASNRTGAARVGTAQGGTAHVGTAQVGTAQVGTAGTARGAARATGSVPVGTTHNGSSSSVPKPRAGGEERSGGEDRWRTAADEGWQRAMAAAEPVDAGTTRSGLPKRVPQAQLVPGGVQAGPRNQNRRSPDEVRGLLSAYHRGVQRGRTDGTAENAASQAKESEQ